MALDYVLAHPEDIFLVDRTREGRVLRGGAAGSAVSTSLGGLYPPQTAASTTTRYFVEKLPIARRAGRAWCSPTSTMTRPRSAASPRSSNGIARCFSALRGPAHVVFVTTVPRHVARAEACFERALGARGARRSPLVTRHAWRRTSWRAPASGRRGAERMSAARTRRAPTRSRGAAGRHGRRALRRWRMRRRTPRWTHGCASSRRRHLIGAVTFSAYCCRMPTASDRASSPTTDRREGLTGRPRGLMSARASTAASKNDERQSRRLPASRARGDASNPAR